MGSTSKCSIPIKIPFMRRVLLIDDEISIGRDSSLTASSFSVWFSIQRREILRVKALTYLPISNAICTIGINYQSINFIEPNLLY